MTQLVPLVALLVYVSPRLAACAAAVLVPFGLALGAARRAYKRANARAARANDALLEAADEAVRHADLWTTFGAEEKARGAVARLGREIARRAALVDASAAAVSGANEVLGAGALALALGAARAGWIGGASDGGTLFAFAIVFFLAYKPLRDLTDARLALARTHGAMEELRAIVGTGALEPDLEERAWTLEALDVRGLALARGDLPPIDLRVGPGEIVCISGATGAGKTTLLRTLLGLDDARAGTIAYGGRELRGVGPRARPFAWVPQDTPVLADTLDANVRLADGATDARAALDAIGAELETGDARLGAGGRAVSGGERQWIALARAIATHQPVLLLDEPTSGLDAKAQDKVLGAIARMRGERSVVVVTHRPEPLAIADVVIRL